jgi:putative transposase
MVLNDTGKIANDCWLQIPQHFPNAILHEHIIMPNHVHRIIELTDIGNVGAKHFSPISNINDTTVGANNHSPLQQHSPAFKSPSKTIGSIVRGYKISVTKWFRTNTDIINVWQRNYYDHIIRNHQTYETILNYIINNPMKWEDDKFFRK